MAELGTAELLAMQQGLTDQQKLIFMSQYNSERKDRTTGLILAVLIGKFGVDRFYLNDIGMGILKFIPLGGCLIWWVVDWFTVQGRVDDYNRRKAQEILLAVKASIP
jgi:TM2 domain-containing membrane protein YozV